MEVIRRKPTPWQAGPGLQNTASDMSDFCIPRHPSNKPVDMAFADSSVRIVGLKELYRLQWSTTFDTTYQDKVDLVCGLDVLVISDEIQTMSAF